MIFYTHLCLFIFNLLDTVIKYYFPKQEKNIISGEEKWIPKKQKIIPEEEKFLERGYKDLIKKEREKNIGKLEQIYNEQSNLNL